MRVRNDKTAKNVRPTLKSKRLRDLISTGLHFGLLIFGTPILGALIGGFGGACVGFLLYWLIDFPNRSFWSIVIVFAVWGGAQAGYAGWKAAFLIYQVMCDQKATEGREVLKKLETKKSEKLQ